MEWRQHLEHYIYTLAAAVITRSSGSSLLVVAEFGTAVPGIKKDQGTLQHTSKHTCNIKKSDRQHTGNIRVTAVVEPQFSAPQ